MAPSPDSRAAYWNAVGASRTFSHPVDFARLDSLLPPDAHILEYGCGYGRVMNDLYQHGYRHVEGVDIADQMIAQGRAHYPHLTFHLLNGSESPYAPGSFDAATLFAALTCIPDDDAQRAVIAAIFRALRPGGLLYISDLPLQADARNRKRYDAFVEKSGVYGVFETPDGGVFRHHDPAWFTTLLADYTLLDSTTCDVTTLNGHTATAIQLFARKP